MGIESSETGIGGETVERRLGAYLRVSTGRQALSLAAQRDAIERFASFSGIEIAGEYIDEGVSGGKRLEDRPAGSLLLADIRAGDIEGVVVAKQDRLFRSCADASRLVEEFRKGGKQIASASENIDSATISGRMTLQMLAVFGENEREMIAERTKATAERLAKERRSRSSRAPFGWRLIVGPDSALGDATDGRSEGRRFARGEGPPTRMVIRDGTIAIYETEDREPTPEEEERNYQELREHRLRIERAFGYVATKDTRQRLERDEDEQRILRRMVRLRKSGLGARRIASALNKYKRDRNPRTGEAWKPSNVQSILRTFDRRAAIGAA